MNTSADVETLIVTAPVSTVVELVRTGNPVLGNNAQESHAGQIRLHPAFGTVRAYRDDHTFRQRRFPLLLRFR